MSDENKNVTVADLLGIPNAKRSKALNTLSANLRGTRIRDTRKIFGTKYTLETLEPVEETWVTNHIPGATPLQIGRNQMAPYAAAALRAIDDVPIEEHFLMPDDASKELVDAMKKSKVLRDDWLRREVLAWLMEDGNQDLVQLLWVFYTELADRRSKALEALDPLAKSRTGGSEEKSSPEKESSAPTLASNG